MSLTATEMNAIVDHHFACEQQDDVAGVLATLSPDVSHDIVGNPGGPTRGPEQAGEFYRRLFADLDAGSIETLRRYHGDNFMVDESLWRGVATGTPFGLPGRNRPLAFRLLHIFEFDEAGRISRENVWLDMAAIMMQLQEDSDEGQ